MTTHEELPVLDPSVVRSLKELGGDDDPGLFDELVDLFVTDARSNVEKLVQALDQRDAQALSRVAHTMKSSSANVGASRMSKLCFEIEKIGRAGSIDGAGELVALAREQFDQVCAALVAQRN